MRTPMLLVVAALALAPPAAAQPSGDPSNVEVEEARKHFNEGVRLSASGKAGEVGRALDEFQKAYDLIPNWRILYNIGQTSRHVRDHARGLRAFSRYLAEGKDEIPKARRQEVEREIAALEPLVGRLELAGTEEGAEVRVDDKPAGQMPLAEPLYLNAGKHTVRVSHEGKRPFERELDLAGGKSERLEILLEPLTGGGPATKPTATATATIKPPPPAPRGDYSTPATLAWIGAGVFAAGAAGIGTWALLESNDLGDTPYAGPDRRPAEDSDLASQASRI
ncbi:MAG: PEGA domain-containing protein, partial [Polyangiaceae bacterium]